MFIELERVTPPCLRACTVNTVIKTLLVSYNIKVYLASINITYLAYNGCNSYNGCNCCECNNNIVATDIVATGEQCICWLQTNTMKLFLRTNIIHSAFPKCWDKSTLFIVRHWCKKDMQLYQVIIRFISYVA